MRQLPPKVQAPISGMLVLLSVVLLLQQFAIVPMTIGLTVLAIVAGLAAGATALWAAVRRARGPEANL